MRVLNLKSLAVRKMWLAQRQLPYGCTCIYLSLCYALAALSAVHLSSLLRAQPPGCAWPQAALLTSTVSLRHPSAQPAVAQDSDSFFLYVKRTSQDTTPGYSDPPIQCFNWHIRVKANAWASCRVSWGVLLHKHKGTVLAPLHNFLEAFPSLLGPFSWISRGFSSKLKNLLDQLFRPTLLHPRCKSKLQISLWKHPHLILSSPQSWLCIFPGLYFT